ncbi:unnamed protein product, partial [Ectocarpus sp. 12 AP-2014]
MIALLKHGADPNVRNVQEGSQQTLLYYCLSSECPISVLREFLAAGPNLDLRDDEGCTALHATRHHPEALSALLRSGADMEAQDSKGQTALHKAAESVNVLCIDVLVSAGA